jgi:methyl-accepting chemotaxis protein
MRQLKIAPRALISFSIIGALVILLGLFAMYQLKSVRTQGEDLSDKGIPSLSALNSINEAMLRLRITAYRLVVDREDAKLRVTMARIDELNGHLVEAMARYEKLVDDDLERAQYQSFKRLVGEYNAVNGELIQLSSADKPGDMLALLGGKYKKASEDLSVQMAALTKINQDGATDSDQQADQAYAEAITGVFAFIIVAAVLTGLMALLFTRSITRPLTQAVRVAQVIAKGDLTESFDVAGVDEPAQLLNALQTMQQNLKSTILNIADSSNQLASAAEELNAVTEDSTRGLHQQNHEIEQAAAAVNEMTAAVDEVARNAVATFEASKESTQTAKHGQQQVSKTVESIRLLSDDVIRTSEEVKNLGDGVTNISKVLDVIRAIAEQTNLLALNAAIEAARAGEAGRGFAVVADEVRALAHRTQTSTQEIEQMVGTIQKGSAGAMDAMQTSTQRARQTLEIAQDAGGALERITDAINQISERNLVIASASEEQAQVSREVDRNLVNIRDLAVQTSDGANQTSAASQELSKLATSLNTLVARFSV